MQLICPHCRGLSHWLTSSAPRPIMASTAPLCMSRGCSCSSAASSASARAACDLARPPCSGPCSQLPSPCASKQTQVQLQAVGRQTAISKGSLACRGAWTQLPGPYSPRWGTRKDVEPSQ